MTHGESRVGDVDLTDPRQSPGEWGSETERVVAEIWTEILGVTPGRDADFFEMGGDSLTATQVTVRVRSALGIRPRIALLFDRPTLSAYAAELGLMVQPGDPADASNSSIGAKGGLR